MAIQCGSRISCQLELVPGFRNFMDATFLINIVKKGDGSWSNWGAWETCSVTCGQGEKTRNRTCDNPTPSNGGQPCDGNSTDMASCSLSSCPGICDL